MNYKSNQNIASLMKRQNMNNPLVKNFFFTLLEKVKKKLGIIKKTLEDLEKMKKYNEKFPLFSSDIQSAQLFTSNSKQLQVFYNEDGMVKLVSY